MHMRQYIYIYISHLLWIPSIKILYKDFADKIFKSKVYIPLDEVNNFIRRNLNYQIFAGSKSFGWREKSQGVCLRDLAGFSNKKENDTRLIRRSF